MTSTIDRPTSAGRAVVRRLRDIEPGPPPNLRPAAVPPPSEPDPPRRHREARARVFVVLRLTIEALDGRRPAAQLAGMATGPVRRYVLAAAGRLHEHVPAGRVGPASRRGGGPGAPGYGGAALRSIRVCHPAAGVAEVSAVWRHHGRYRALAARFELLAADELLDKGMPPATDRAEHHRATRWCCTALRLG